MQQKRKEERGNGQKKKREIAKRKTTEKGADFYSRSASRQRAQALTAFDAFLMSTKKKKRKEKAIVNKYKYNN